MLSVYFNFLVRFCKFTHNILINSKIVVEILKGKRSEVRGEGGVGLLFSVNLQNVLFQIAVRITNSQTDCLVFRS